MSDERDAGASAGTLAILDPPDIPGTLPASGLTPISGAPLASGIPTVPGAPGLSPVSGMPLPGGLPAAPGTPTASGLSPVLSTPGRPAAFGSSAIAETPNAPGTLPAAGTPARKKGLGRGLDALLGAARLSQSASRPPGGADTLPSEAAPTVAGGERLVRIPLERLRRGHYQPRRDFDPDALRELADSIRVQGVLQPILVRPLGGEHPDRYEILAGERRWRACQQAGLASIPALVREVDEQTALAIALIENLQRADLHPLEEASALERLIDEFGLTHQQIAEALGKSRTAITNLLRLLELDPEVRDHLERGRLEMGHARALLGLKDEAQRAAARQVIQAGLNVRETERLVRRLQQTAGSDAASSPPLAPDPDIRRLQTDLSDRLGASVEIRHGRRGAGRLVIAYNSLDELDGILAHIR